VKIEIAGVQDVAGVWPLVGPKFCVASEKCGDDLTAGELWQLCRSGNAFLIVAYEETKILMASVVRFERWNNGSVLRVLSLVGDEIGKWAEEVKEFLKGMGKANGAGRIVAEGRDGWARIFDEPRKLRSTYEMRIA
jgi:hypothetical protein